jgi:poly(3-hydroxybutyrate) depolymerase
MTAPQSVKVGPRAGHLSLHTPAAESLKPALVLPLVAGTGAGHDVTERGMPK